MEFEKFVEIDPHIEHFKDDIILRYNKFKEALDEIEMNEVGGLESFIHSYKEYGLNILDDGKILCKEWIPDVKYVSLVGDFNEWNIKANPLESHPYGVWKTVLEHDSIKHMSKYKLYIEYENNSIIQIYRLSPWAKYVIQNDSNKLYDAVLWNPKNKFEWKYEWPLLKAPMNKSLRIYECHIGISSEEYKISTYKYFKEKVIPHIVYLNYNAIQLMGIMEHAYYASFGYQVTSFFAASSRYGNLDDLKELIDECHKYNIRVLLDVIHSHACKNVEDGLNQFNGREGCYFHDNERGYHKLWDSRLFNYNLYEVKRFLLSNLFYYLEEFRFDGFRFDGVTSMLYHHHGIDVGFSGDYHEYFGIHVDIESITYIQLANYSLKKYYPNIITIAEEVSGIPGLCRKISEGGLGFDYRLAMGIPDFWIKLLKEISDEHFNMWNIIWCLINRRHGEKHVAYAESHDQALVGDKTLAFWLMDSQMYSNMSLHSHQTICIDRGISLHKLIRLITIGLGGEAYLNFMGNEFGHPEWLDFPRQQNGNSFHYARRQWHLVHDHNLRYRFLNEFDRHLQLLEDKYNFLSSPQAYVSKHHEFDKIIVFERGGLLFVFNFHHSNSYSDYLVPLTNPINYKIILSTDDQIFHGHHRIDTTITYNYHNIPYCGLPFSLKLYIPSRVALVLVSI